MAKSKYQAIPKDDSSDSDNEQRDVVSGFGLCCRNCTFTYLDEDVDLNQGTNNVRAGPSSTTSARDLLTKGLHKIKKIAKPPRLDISTCNFIPPSDANKTAVDKFLRASMPGLKIKFETCTFVRRESSFLEKCMDFLHSCLPYSFQIYISNVGQEAVLSDYTICLKNLPGVLSKVQESALSRTQAEGC